MCGNGRDGPAGGRRPLLPSLEGRLSFITEGAGLSRGSIPTPEILLSVQNVENMQMPHGEPGTLFCKRQI